jgi:ribosomal protein RSM22 (predicted rRNA methylase)
MLPEALRRAIDDLAAAVPPGRLRAAAAELTRRYHDEAARGTCGVEAKPRGGPSRDATGSAGHGAPTDAERRLAYVVARLPATLAATRAVLGRLQEALPDLRPSTLLDLGAGPGGGVWAAEQVFGGSLDAATLVDQHPEMLALARRLRECAAASPRPEVAYLTSGLGRLPEVGGHDLVLCSYVLSELGDSDATIALEHAWRATRQALVLVEPGWPRGHARLMAWRHRLLEWGAHVVAPCPHDLPCPLVGDDWCHFAERLERSRLHRLVKGGALGWEDEKYAYLVATRTPAWRPPARIIHPPRIEKGHVRLHLCRDGRAEPAVVTRRDGPAFKSARKAAWGDGFASPGARSPEP